MRKLTKRQEDSLQWSLAGWLAINAGGAVRLVIGAPIEWFLGLSPMGIFYFRFFSWGFDSVLAVFFGLARRGAYDLGVIDENKFWHKAIFDTVFISVYKDISYVFSLWLLTNLPRKTFWLMVGINVALFVVTGAINCYYVDVLRKHLPDLTDRLMTKIREKRPRRKKKVH